MEEEIVEESGHAPISRETENRNEEDRGYENIQQGTLTLDEIDAGQTDEVHDALPSTSSQSASTSGINGNGESHVYYNSAVSMLDLQDREHVEVDVVILGGGITGTACAYGLAIEQDVENVLVIEKVNIRMLIEKLISKCWKDSPFAPGLNHNARMTHQLSMIPEMNF